MPNDSTAVAFWVAEQIQLQLQSEDICDWYRVVLTNGVLDRRINSSLDGGAIPQGLSTRTLAPGIYGVVAERPPTYTITSGLSNADIRTKSGKDPWPPPPPPLKPQEFVSISQADWNDFHANEFLVLVGGEADAE